MPPTTPRSEPLDTADCYRLLATGCVGRVVGTFQALPVVLPVNYCLDGHHIVFRTTPTGQLAALTNNTVVAFEVDEIDAGTWTGWSVVVTGVASPVTSPGDLVRVGQLALVSWLGEGRDHVVQIVPGLVTGRRLHAAAEPAPAPAARTLEVATGGGTTWTS